MMRYRIRTSRLRTFARAIDRFAFRHGFKPTGMQGYRFAAVMRTAVVLGGGMFIAIGWLDLSWAVYIPLACFVIGWSLFVWWISPRAGIWLDGLDLVIDSSLIALVIRWTGGPNSPAVTLVYLMLMGLYGTNVRHWTWKSATLFSLAGWIPLVCGVWGFPGAGRFLGLHTFGIVLFNLLGYILFAELARRESDPLTQVWNRRYGLEILETWLLSGKSFYLAFLDLDGFKAINDRLGHRVGDEVLQAVAGRLRHAFRAGDIIIRYGGDEFLIASTYSDLESRIQRLFRDPIHTSAGSVVLGCTIGVVRREAGEDLEQLLKRADSAMYGKKNEEKNRNRTTGKG